MRLSLIGMSGSGKSLWSRRLRDDCGFDLTSCDKILDRKLELLIPKSNRPGTNDVPSWLGQPYEVHFKENQKILVDCEINVMREVLGEESIHSESSCVNVVIDTSGSVIYCGEEILSRLKEITTVVYFETPLSAMDVMYERFLSSPSKAIVWGDLFNKLSGETDSDALERCYPKLCRWREDHYRAIADVTIPYEVRESKEFTTKELLRRVDI